MNSQKDKEFYEKLLDDISLSPLQKVVAYCRAYGLGADIGVVVTKGTVPPSVFRKLPSHTFWGDTDDDKESLAVVRRYFARFRQERVLIEL